MSQGEQFLELFNQLDDHLRKLLRQKKPSSDSRMGFAATVRELVPLNSTVKRNEYWLLEFGDFRNALVHEKTFNGVRILADPRLEALNEFREFVQGMIKPTDAYSISSTRVREFQSTDELGEALSFMKEHDFSQIVVRHEGQLCLLSQAGFTSWLQSKYLPGWIVESPVMISEVLSDEPKGTFQIAARRDLADDVIDKFLRFPNASSEVLRAVIVTDSARRTEKPIGLITPWDALKHESRNIR